MLTKWGKKLVQNSGFRIALPTQTFSAANNYGFVNAKTTTGSGIVVGPYTSFPENYTLLTSISEKSSNATGIAFGSGSTPATDEDYTIESIISTISANTPTVVTSFDATNNKFVSYVEYTITNTGSASISISELARFVLLQKATALGELCSTSTGERYNILIDHVILDDPVVISPGESGIVRYSASYTE